MTNALNDTPWFLVAIILDCELVSYLFCKSRATISGK
jgi:hypothetical protein